MIFLTLLVLNKENRCDDKQILNICAFLKSLDREEVKCFLYNTLILRYLFDTYVVKRNSEGWCLLRYRDLNEYTPAFEALNRDIVNIESLYASSLDHKEWLMPLFKFLKGNVNASGVEVLNFLKSLSFSSQRYELYKQNYYEKDLQSPPYLIIENEKLVEVK